MDERQDRVREALRLLQAEVRERLARRAGGGPPPGGEPKLDLRLSLPVRSGDGAIDRAAALAGERLQGAVEDLLAFQAAVRPGRVLCLRCGSAECDHAAGGAAREVFAGYGSTGLPRFLDFGQWLLERRDPRIDRLYAARPALVARADPGRDLVRGVLPAYRDGGRGYRLHGQVAAGWFLAAYGDGPAEPFAATFQLLSTRAGGQPRRFAWNLLATPPRGEGLDTLLDRLGEIPWAPALRWAGQRLHQIERALEAGSRLHRAALQRRLEGLVEELARRLEKGSRARRRRTRHAEQRHREGTRPTRLAVADLRQADADELLFDTRNRTLIVLGARSRAHAFSLEGRLVTSIYYTPAAVRRRRISGLWRPADPDEVAAVRRQLEREGDGEPVS